MVVAQVVSTLHVYLSNIHLYRQMRLIADAGYLPVPNVDTLPLLQKAGSAFGGGLFFTLTVGAFLSLLTFSFSWGFVHIFQRRKWMMLMGAAGWALLLWLVNAKRFDAMTTTYFFIIPPVVFAISIKGMVNPLSKKMFVAASCHVVVLSLLVMVWTFQLDQRMFIDFRDGMLLSNPVGERINNFYYQYTLYPAGVFKSPEQKLLKTVYIGGEIDAHSLARLEKKCIAYDYLPVQNDTGVDLVLYRKGDQLTLQYNGKPVQQTTIAAFLADPRQHFRDYSRQIDKYAFFRHFTFVSLLIGLPIFLYVIIYAGIRSVILRILGNFPAAVVSILLCFLAGLALLIPFHLSRAGQFDEQDVTGLMMSKDWMDRVNGLKIIYENRLEPSDYPSYRDGLHSPHIPERYWLAMVLGQSRKQNTFEDLKAMVNDPNLNVVCQVFHAFGKRGNRSMIPVLLKKLRESRCWYEQTYAYHALRELGWTQEKSNPA